MRRWSITKTLHLLLIPLLIVGIAVCVVARAGLNNNATEVIKAQQIKELAVSVLALLLTQDDATKVMLLDPDKLTEEAARKIAAYDAHVGTLARMQTLSPSPAVSAIIVRLGNLDQHELRPIDSRILESLAAGKIDEARALYFSDYEPRRATYEALIKQLADEAEGAAATALQAMDTKNRRTFLNTMLVLFVGVLVVSGILTLIARHVRTRLLATIGVLEAVAERDLTQRLPITSEDEFGRIAVAVNHSVEAMGTALGEMLNSVAYTHAASQNLAAAAGRLSTGAQQQASALEETVASMEEMTVTVKQNADNARQADQLSVGARDVAERGGSVVTAAVASMSEITAASKKITEISSVIDEIAFQTNLLALNAAVEAARAGDQGRGFAVVAAEIRNLAQRSASAAKEIKGLIQNTGQKVADGAAMVSKSGDTLTNIITSVKRVSDIVTEITAASLEQAQGIDQVNRTVTQMDSVTQTNAAQTEELSSMAQSLAVQAQQLQRLVSGFKLTESPFPPQEDNQTTQHALTVAPLVDRYPRVAQQQQLLNGTRVHGRGKAVSKRERPGKVDFTASEFEEF